MRAYTCYTHNVYIHIYVVLTTDGGDRTYTITTAIISNKFSRESPYMSNTFSRESENFKQVFTVSKRSPRHAKETTDFCSYLEIQIFEV